jgi:hypothetical protein
MISWYWGELVPDLTFELDQRLVLVCGDLLAGNVEPLLGIGEAPDRHVAVVQHRSQGPWVSDSTCDLDRLLAERRAVVFLPGPQQRLGQPRQDPGSLLAVWSSGVEWR